MKSGHSGKIRIYASLLFSLATLCAAAQKVPRKKEVLQALTTANDHFMRKWPDPGKAIVKGSTYPSNIWPRAVYFEGLLALHQVAPDKKYKNYAVAWGNSHNWQIPHHPFGESAFDLACGQPYIDLYLMDSQEERIDGIKAAVDHLVDNTKTDAWTFVDALHMAMPLFARMGLLYNDDAYYKKMYDLFMYTKAKHSGHGLYNPDDGLWWRDQDFVPPFRTPGGKPSYWSRGNGWAVAGLVRVLDVMPSDAPFRDEYLKTYLEMMKAIKPLQREDGFWNVSLADPVDFGGPELSGTALFVYGMAWGVRHGVLDAAVYQPVINKAWEGMIKKSLLADGSLGFVQGLGRSPKDGQPLAATKMPDFEEIGLGCFLLAGSELARLGQ